MAGDFQLHANALGHGSCPSCGRCYSCGRGGGFYTMPFTTPTWGGDAGPTTIPMGGTAGSSIPAAGAVGMRLINTVDPK